MTYADARYELLNMKLGSTQEIAGHVITRHNADVYEMWTLNRSLGVLERTLDAMGFVAPRQGSAAGAMVAEYQAETGCDWSSALAACNVD